jgi:predicted short-subunit dehydrogenase-like oxidoreductase (DUF2520 family)
MDKGVPMPKKIVLADDTLTADSAFRLACAGHGLLWRGDFQNARQLLQALARGRADRVILDYLEPLRLAVDVQPCR